MSKKKAEVRQLKSLAPRDMGKLLVLQEREITRLKQELTRLKLAWGKPRLGCPDCKWTGFVDEVNPATAEVAHLLCPGCCHMTEQFIEVYLGTKE